VGHDVSKNWVNFSHNSTVNPYLGIDGLKLLEGGKSAQEALDELIEADPGRDDRQVGIVDSKGRSAAYTGASCVDWAGHGIGKRFSGQGNMLVGAATVAKMAEVAEGCRFPHGSKTVNQIFSTEI
jgi:uncharacterized Ntn-hydrolase superfamily protein